MTFVEHAPGGLRQRYGAMLTEAAMALMLRFLTYDPTRRITAEEALRHEYFQVKIYEAPLKRRDPPWSRKGEQYLIKEAPVNESATTWSIGGNFMRY